MDLIAPWATYRRSMDRMSTRQLDRVFEEESMDSEWIALILLQPAGGGPCGRNHMLG
jgi:hypothetical protein